ncbi:hypothetical protein Tco_0546846 [Tanacetum coccineum]
MYERQKKFDQSFVPIGSVDDEKMIEKMNKKAAGIDEEQVIKEPDSTKEESKEEEGTRKRKLSTKKKMKSKKEAPDEDKEVDYEILDKKYPIIEWKSVCLGTKPQFDETKDLKEINLNIVVKSNGQKRFFSTLMKELSMFDREDLNAVYQLVMDRYQNEVPEGFDRVLWGDLMLMFSPRIVIHMLVEKKYHLKKNVLLQMLKLKLESEEDITMALELIRFVKKLIVELEPDGDEKDGSQLTLLNSKELASPGSNSSWFSIHLVVYNEELAIPEQTTLKRMELRMIEGKTLKDQRSPPGTITEDRKVGIGSPPTEDLITDCSPVYPKA